MAPTVGQQIRLYNIAFSAVYLKEYALKSNLGILDALIAITAVESEELSCTAHPKNYRAIAKVALRIFKP